MRVWGLKIKDNKIIGGGSDIVFDGTFDYIIPTTEQFSRQGMKLDLIDGKLIVKEGMKINTVEELNLESFNLANEFTTPESTVEIELQVPINI